MWDWRGGEESSRLDGFSLFKTHIGSFDSISGPQVDVPFAGVPFCQLTVDERLAVDRRAALRVHDFLAGFS